VAGVNLLLEGGDASEAFDAAWTFWVGDAVAIASIVPAVLLVAAAIAGEVRAPRLPSKPADRAEILVQSLALIVAPVVALAVADQNEASGFLVLSILPVVWVALRRDIVLAAVGLLVLNSTLSIAASRALGPSTDLAELQAVMLAASLAGLYIAAVTRTQEIAFADLLESEDRYRAVLEGMPCLTVRFTRAGDVRFANAPAWLEGAGGTDRVVQPLQREWDVLAATVLADGAGLDHTWEVDGLGRHQWFTARLGPERLADGSIDGVVAVIIDLTPEREAAEAADRERWTDPLTGLANRRRFFDLIGERAERPDGRPLGVAMIDLDGFKGVNEALDHDAGDAVLLHATDRLRRAIGTDGIVARLAADEFAVAVPIDDETAMAKLGNRLLTDVRIRVPVGGGHHLVTCSVGVAVGSGDTPARRVVQDAESALAASKESGRNRATVYEDRHRMASADREERLGLIHQSLDQRTVVVHYQPLVDLATGGMVAVEALARLTDRTGNLVPPGAFIPLAEEVGLDIRLGALVLERALEDLARWPSPDSEEGLMMGVNVTARQLTQPGYVHQVLAACNRAGISPACVCLELTETLVMADPVAATKALESLRLHGVTTALDDFGVGYSSIEYLQRLPIDVLKIDRAFVAGLPDDPSCRSIVGLVVGLADALGMRVTAEGIETEAQRACLLELGCERGQGFLFDRPIDAQKITERLARGGRVGAAHR
jgi:diguanylate cyclase (GGDEF)-like protein